jgi:hypothetical protein
MPTYDFACNCGARKQDVFVRAEEHFLPCGCGEKMIRQFPVSRRQFIVGELDPYYDEGLGYDVHSRAERRQIMDALGVQEAGDAVNGSRSYDQSVPFESRVEKRPPIGRRFAPAKENEGDFVLGIESQDGSVREANFNSLPTPKPADPEKARKAFDAIQ